LEDRIIYKYDAKGNQLESSDYDSDGNLIDRYNYKYDANGNEVENSSYDSNGRLENKYTTKYDANGNIVERNEYDSDGNIVSKSTHKYDSKGNLVEYNDFESGTHNKKYIFNYDHYDEMGNWCRKVTYYQEKPTSLEKPTEIIERKITYYP
jgi:hypothetical protein